MTNELAVSVAEWLARMTAVSEYQGSNHRRRLCLPLQLLRYTALGMGCAPLLQCLGRLSLTPSIERYDEYQLMR